MKAPLRAAALASVAVLLVLLATAGSASAANDLRVTLAARFCPDYKDITANRARNDIQESLRDLGPNSPYKAGQAIDPQIEATSQSACQPLPDWKFSVGDGFRTRAVSGPWGSLSIVKNPSRTNVTTLSSTPLLNNQGNPTGKDLEGAVTIDLSDLEAGNSTRKKLWIQGGTPTDPILNSPYPGQYGFGALRCAIDNLNGDNVEFVSFPSGVKHVFCFAYYVKPPPTSGTITIKKQVSEPGVTQSFGYGGNLSFNANGRFSLDVKNGGAAQETFYRAETKPGDDPWTVSEDVPPGWQLDDLTCSAPGGSGTVIDKPTATVAITLKAGDNVVCTYANELQPKPGRLTVSKTTEGGVGKFDYSVEPIGGGAVKTMSATTTAEGVAVAAKPDPLELEAGNYKIDEISPPSTTGRWKTTQLSCDGVTEDPSEPAEVQIGANVGSVCAFTNEFIPKGEIDLRKLTRGATGTAGFQIYSVDDPSTQLFQKAATQKPGEAVLAKGDDSNNLPLGKYVIQETAMESDSGTWKLTGLECNGTQLDTSQGKATIELTRSEPRFDCTFENTFFEGYKVTLAARFCPDYTDITANLARNDIQESLRDLGPDSPYRAGEAIDAKVEADNQPACQPLPGWTFSLGNGYASRAVSGSWGALSVVKNPSRTDVVTKASVPLLDSSGANTGRRIDGAVTIELSEQELAQAGRGNLWIQGGTPTDPVLDGQFPGEYGFGALRCAIDDLNGDNVEWASYPAGAKHVFCFAYYVKPAPASGTITIRKEVEDAGKSDETFPFAGNLSFSQDSDFTLDVKDGKPAAETFYRAETRPGDEPWLVREEIPPGWELRDLSCTSQGGSAIDIDEARAKLEIDLEAGDDVTCTYVNGLVPEPGALTLRKVSEGALGTFDFEVDPKGKRSGTKLQATTAEEGVAAVAEPGPLELRPGMYSLSEQLPESGSGRWDVANVQCNGEDLGAKEKVTVEIRAAEGLVCTYFDEFTPRGELKIRKETRGGTGTAGFSISSADDPAVQFFQTATTTKQNDPVPADGDSTDDLELGRYVIQETQISADDGTWQLTGLECNDRPVPFSGGQATVELTRNDPKQTCTFVNSRSDSPQPRPTSKKADLRIRKRVRPPVARPGQTLHYTVVVENLGPDRADDVYVQDLPGGPARIVSLDRRCSRQKPIVCYLGSIKPGKTKELKVSLEPKQKRGRFVNRASVTSSTPDPRLGNNKQDVGTDILKQKPPDPCARDFGGLIPRC